MKLKQTIPAAALGLALLVAPALPALAEDATVIDLDTNPAIELPFDNGEESQALPAYLSFSGVVKEITQMVDAEEQPIAGSYFVLVEGEEEQLVNFRVTEETYLATEGELEVGAEVTGFYRGDLPVIMIYPAQYSAVVLVVETASETPVQNVLVDHFDENLLNQTGDLKLNISNETEIVTPDGEAYTGEISNRDLVVYTGVMALSYPAQTSPTKIVVLPVRAVTLPIDVEEPETGDLSIEGMPIVVEGQTITAPGAYQNADEVVMVPLRAISEALGYSVDWDAALKAATLNEGAVTVAIGSADYGVETASALAAAELKDGTTYVPLQFFKQVLGLNNAYIFEGQIDINNDEEMI